MFSCSHCSYTVFNLTPHSLYTQVMPIVILLDVEYSRNVVFSFERGLNDQRHSSSDSHHPIKKSPKAKFHIHLPYWVEFHPYPLTLFGKPWNRWSTESFQNLSFQLFNHAF